MDGETIIASNGWSAYSLGHYLRRSPRRLEIIDIGYSVEQAEAEAQRCGTCWLVLGGHHREETIKGWMRQFHPIWETSHRQEQLLYYPDFAAFVRRRALAGIEHPLVDDFLRERQSRLDFDARDRIFRGSGWGEPETSGDGTGFVWATGRRSEVAVALAEPGAVEVRFRALALDYPGAPPQRVRVEWDDSTAGELQLGGQWRDAKVRPQTGTARAGLHLVTFHFSRAEPPARVIQGSDDRRPLAAAFDHLEVVPIPAADEKGR